MNIDKIDPIVGRTLGDFLVKEKLGEGGFGAVYKATQLTLEREAVIKVLHTRHRTNKSVIKRFKREARLASSLEHPYCAHIYSFGAESDGLLWIAMEMVAGTPLNEILKSQGSLSLEKFVPLLDKICEVVHTAHEAGIIHRDLKPANVMIISRAGRLLPKLLDFGIAKDLHQNSPEEKIGFIDKSPKYRDSKETNKINSQKTITNDHFVVKTDALNDKNTVVDNDNLIDQETIIKSNGLRNQETIIENNNLIDQETTISNENIDIEDFLKLGQIANNKKPIIELKINKNSINIETLKTHGVIGTPSYMPPEQWENGANADARSDIYSLGILAYQAITGTVPFKEKGFELYGAHLSKPVPPLKSSFPSKLNDVLQKALSKRVEDRYQTALEFAKNFHQAANFDEEKANLPQFDEIVKENLLTNAPKPIAESVASLLASHNAYQFKDRVLLVFRVLIRYIGILSIASYTSIADKIQNNELINKSISALYQETLNEAQWIELSRELCRSFSKKRDAFAVAELVSLFFANNDSSSSISEIFASLLQLQEKITMAVSLKEENLVELLEQFLFKLTILLKEVSWICDYHLVLPKDNQATKWMGIAKHLSIVPVKSSNLANEKAMLIDVNGYFVLSLWPLVEIVEPSLGAVKEVFLLDGKGRNGAKLVSFPQAFEIERQSAFDWIKEYFFKEDEKSKEDLLLEKSPYLGLASFSSEDSTLFFGREKETESFLNRLRVQPLLAVVGASGAGKSSFIQAGIVANLDKSWKILTTRPGISPISTLSAKLSKLGLELTDLKSELEKDIEYLSKLLRMFAIANSSKVLIVVDQFEEIFTLCLNRQEQKLYVEALVSLARSEEDPIRVVLTMRDDFLVRAKELNSLKDRLNQSIEILTTPDSTQLLRILVLPARRIGYEFEDNDLAIEIVNQLTDQASALPLLAFTAAKLWEQRDSQFKQLRRRNYELLGGVGGALAHHAESMLQQMTNLEQSLVKEAFRHLVTSQGTRAILTRLELLQLLGKTRDSESVIEKLIQARLLVATEGEKGTDRIEIIHEALLSTWPRLVKWRQEMAEGARLRDQLRAAARQWQERHRPKGLLWRDEVLTEYQLWRSYYVGRLTDIEEEFVQASLSDASRTQQIRRALAISIMSVLLIASAVLFYQRQQTKQQLLKTLELYEEEGRQQILKGKLDGAAVYLSEAYAKGDNSLALKYMLSVALAKVENHPPINLSNHTDAVTMATFSPDDSLVVTASKDKTARLWQANDGKELFVLKGHEDTILSSKFSFDGKLLVTASSDKTARLWKVSDGNLVAVLQGHTEALKGAEFSPDGSQILTWSYDQTAKIWDSTTGKLLNTLEGHTGAIYTASYSKTGKLIATASADKTTKTWDGSSGQLKHTLIGHQAAVVSLAFSPDEKLLVTGSTDKTAKIWQLQDGQLLNIQISHQSGVTDCKFSPDGKEILTTSNDTKAYLWESSTGKLLWTLEGHTADIVTGDFSFDGNLIITNSYDNTIRIWERTTGKFLVAFAEHKDSLVGGLFSNKMDKILSASADKTAKIWQLEVEKRSPKEVSKIVEEKVQLKLVEGRLISTQPPVQESVKEVIKVKEHVGENLYVEDLGDGLKLEMLKIQAGEFEMGSPATEKGHNGDERLHKVKISKDFYIGRYEVTQTQWKAIAGLPTINIPLKSDPSRFKGDNLPVENISWHEVVEFCARLSKLAGKQYRLPTEAEWEYVARAGNKSEYPDNLEEVAWFEKNSGGKTHIVGQRKANPWGLYDMFGNVYEWCSDWYGDYPTTEIVDPSGATSGATRVGRGCSWLNPTVYCRSAYRLYGSPNTRNNFLGLRLVMVPK